MNDRDEEKLERLIEDACSGLPLRQAPAALERRVLEEVVRRAALPWWRRGFTHWPMAARAGFVIVCVVLAGLSLSGSVAHQVDTQTLFWIRPLVGLITTMGGTATLIANLVPPLWIYVCLGIGALLYLLLFGLGAFAYRTLYLQHSNDTMIRT